MSPTASLRQRTQCYHFSTWTTIHSGSDLPHFSIRRNSIIPKSQIRESNLPRTTPYQQFKRKAPLVWPAGYLPCNSLCFWQTSWFDAWPQILNFLFLVKQNEILHHLLLNVLKKYHICKHEPSRGCFYFYPSKVGALWRDLWMPFR